ncbi:WW domain-binding protein 2 [Lingula anatina]|uniref:WW domain-binding protein 2 n=1 Tax=Lingula anatina TaxID=7574 RepID=A0A1S3HL85_LINAN|nr:WW domain-binding protein 2 [Lingula anatina]|eukprot:XP_013386870.1 WW domain-binding protein 2 [Lingula anatina]
MFREYKVDVICFGESIMSLNTAHANGGVLIYCGERILIYYDNVEVSLESEGGPVPQFKGNKKGRLYLTTHRVIFNNRNNKDVLQSFSMPFFCMKQLELEQPVFGANYIKGKVVAEQNGNWQGIAKFKMWFNSGGAIEFGQAMLEAGRLANRNRPPQPPPYFPPAGPFYQAPPPAYAPPGEPLYGFVPYQTFPTAPPADGVYMTEAPPPYPGIDPNLRPPPYPPQQNNSADAKAAEAAASAYNGAYYDPGNPHNVYMPPPQGAPPAYSEAAKKYD